MSFITKRERVFNEYDLFDLPPRNEGKLKAYASCTDSRAWSHFCSDKSEHLVEIIKRNNDTCRPKYVPTDVIVQTLMIAKNAEIGRLKRKIEEFEQLLASYDELDLTCEQKCEIATAHAAIKAANKELDDLCLDLDLSGYTEGVDSEAFETGKSRGDELSRYQIDETAKSKGDEWIYERGSVPKMEAKCNQTGLSCVCDASTSATDPRIEEMQGDIIVKDAKLSSMNNTIAVMENDVCEPYCIYAHIYTALEKIFGVLCQNDKYRQYLDQLTSGKDIRFIDIKGKILYKIKVFEKFCFALIAPCSQETDDHSTHECSCYYAEVIGREETTFALTSFEYIKPSLDNKRAHLVADIIHNNEMKEILSKNSSCSDKHLVQTEDDVTSVDNYSIDGENLKRLKVMQESYDDLMTCYESLKHEVNCLKMDTQKYQDLETELENLRMQLREYNTLWTEKEYYKNRSIKLDELKEQYLLLSNETASLEAQLQAEVQINSIKSQRMDDLKQENILLEKKLNEASIAFEKDKNILMCKLSETECKVMCEEQQIKSLLIQIDTIMEQSHEKEVTPNEVNTIILLDQIESQKEQIRNLKEALFCNEEDKQNLQQDFHDKIENINELKMEIEDWKDKYNKTIQQNEYLNKYIDSISKELNKLATTNKTLSHEVEEKTSAVENLRSIVNNKAHEVDRLIEEKDSKSLEYENLFLEYKQFQEKHKIDLVTLDNEKTEVFTSLQLARNESEGFLKKIKYYDDIIQDHDETSKVLKLQTEKYHELKQLLLNTMQENKDLKANLNNLDNQYSIALQEVQQLRELNSHINTNIKALQNERDDLKITNELAKKDSKELKDTLFNFENIRQELDALQESQEKLIDHNQMIKNELYDKTVKLDFANNSIELYKKESCSLLDKIQEYKNANDSLIKVRAINEALTKKNLAIMQDLATEKKQVELLEFENNKIKEDNQHLLQMTVNKSAVEKEFIDLRGAYDKLFAKKVALKKDANIKMTEINRLNETLKDVQEENIELTEQIRSFKRKLETACDNMKALEEEHLITLSTIGVFKEENAYLSNKVNQHETLKIEYKNLIKSSAQIRSEKELLETNIFKEGLRLNHIEQENYELQSHSETLLSHSKDLEKALLNARSEISTKSNLLIQSQYADVLNEIIEMKKEKHLNQSKIRDLLNKLDDTDTIISDLSEQISARDTKIVVLQNHINDLEDEVRKLHNCLDEVVNAGEEITENSYQNIDQSLKKMEAHHSKAAHNIKLELAQLQNENTKLEKQLSSTNIKSDEIFKDKHLYISQIINLQIEREIIVTNIKQLEISFVGDSALSPNKCETDDILNSLERIQLYLDGKKSRSNSLEQTLFQVQTSSQLLLSKAEEAKKIIEIEKQKAIYEKEEVIKERAIIEKQLEHLKAKFEKQISCDQFIIRDLEAEILNKQLIIDKINELSQSYIPKLEEEIQTMKELYVKSIEKLAILETKLKSMTDESENKTDVICQINKQLDIKSKEVDMLQQSIDKIKNKPQSSSGVQTQVTELMKSTEIQTAKWLSYEKLESAYIAQKDDLANFRQELEETTKKIQPNFANEIQVNNANIQPTLDYVRNIYLSYKLKQLDRCKINQYSLTSLIDDTARNSSKTLTSPRSEMYAPSQTLNETEKAKQVESHNIVNLYNKSFICTDSSKISNTDEQDAVFTSKLSIGTRTGFSAFTDITNDRLDTKPLNVYNDIDKSSNLFNNPISENSKNKDVFFIYQEADSNITQDYSEPWSPIGLSEILVETCTVSPYKDINSLITDKSPHMEDDDNGSSNHEKSLVCVTDLEQRNDGIKNQLNIRLPRVKIESQSISSSNFKNSVNFNRLDNYPSSQGITISNINISIDHDANKISQKTSLPSILNNESQYFKAVNLFKTNIRENGLPGVTVIKRKSDTNGKIHNKRASSNHKKYETGVIHTKKSDLTFGHNRLTVDTNIILPRNENVVRNDTFDNNGYSNFGIQYILDTLNCEIQPEYIKKHVDNSPIHETRSDDRLTQNPSNTSNNSSPSLLLMDKLPLRVYEIDTNHSTCKSSIGNGYCKFQEQSVMVKIDTDSDYENRIRNLTKILENTEKDYKNKIAAIKLQYDNNVKCIINDHNQGVKTIQSIHEEKFQDIIKVHENEVENLRSMSIEAMRKAERLEKENRALRANIFDSLSSSLNEEVTTNSEHDAKICKKYREMKTLTKTAIEAFNVKPKVRSHGPCTCSVEVNISETIRNIFEQVDAEQRRKAEHAYIKYIANKLINDNMEIQGMASCDAAYGRPTLLLLCLVHYLQWKSKETLEIWERVSRLVEKKHPDKFACGRVTEIINCTCFEIRAKWHTNMVTEQIKALDVKELSFLHLKVCRTWKTKMSKEDILQKRIDLLENELMHKQLNAQQHMAELDREVIEERQRLQDLREAVCRKTLRRPGYTGTEPNNNCVPSAGNKSLTCKDNTKRDKASISERHSAGDLVTDFPSAEIRSKRVRIESNNRAVLAKLDAEERRHKKPYSDEPPTRLRKSHDRQTLRLHKKNER